MGQSKCLEIEKKCQGAGYLKGGNPNAPKKGLWTDCIDPLVEGKKISGIVVSTAVVAACKSEREVLLNRDKKCESIVSLCKTAGFIPGGAVGKRTWADCVGPISNGKELAGITVPATISRKTCSDAMKLAANQMRAQPKAPGK